MFSKTPYLSLLEIFWKIHEEQTTGYDKDDYTKWLLSFGSCPEILCRRITLSGGLRDLDTKLWNEIRKRHNDVVPGHISFKSREEMYKCKVCGFEIPCDAMYPLCNLHDKYRQCSWCNELVGSVDKNRRCKEHERMGTCCVCREKADGVLKGYQFFCDEHSNMILCSVCESWCDDPEERDVEGHTIKCCKTHGDLNWCEYGDHPTESEITEKIEGTDACEECNDDDDIKTCDRCDERVHIDHTTYADNTCYCESCAEDHVYYCVECDEYFDDDGGHRTDSGMLCDDCYWDVHFTCDLCGEHERIDDKCTIITGPSSEMSICVECNARIDSFHCENAREDVETCFCPVKSDLIDKIEKIATKLDLSIEPRDDILDRIIAAL